MSAAEIKELINTIRKNIAKPYGYRRSSIEEGYAITEDFLHDINLLQQTYGAFIGKSKANHREVYNELTVFDNYIVNCFESLVKSSNAEFCFKVVGLATGKISELISFTDALDIMPPEEKISKSKYENLLKERDELKKTIDIMVQYKGLPELNTLMETAKNNSLPLDEYWVLALCSSNLIEAVVNKKLELLGEKAEGNFEDRYKKLCKVIKEKEGKDIFQLLPSAVYKVRNKLDHSSESNTVTPKEAKEISRMVIDFMNTVFTSKT
jgi:hypothetical protein